LAFSFKLLGVILRKNRFHGLGSLRYVYKNGRTTRNSELSVRVSVNARRQTYRCAVVVSKKVSKSAVVRNRIRRRIYELVRQISGDITGAYDIVITVFTPQLAKTPTTALQKSLYQILSQAGVIYNHNSNQTKNNDIIDNKEL